VRRTNQLRRALLDALLFCYHAIMLHDPAEHEPDPPSEVGIWLFMLIVAVFAFFALPFIHDTPLDMFAPPNWLVLFR
jgi:hypothetical protein